MPAIIDLETIGSMIGGLGVLGIVAFLATREQRKARADSFFWEDIFGVRGGVAPRAAGPDLFDAVPSDRAWYEVLGVVPGASRREIRAAYRRRIQQVHPDRNRQLAEPARAMAEAEARALNEAYRFATRRHR